VDTKTMIYALAQSLADRTDMVWRPTGPAYTEAEAGINYGALPQAPNQSIGMTAYYADDDLETSLAVRRVQLRFRGNPGERAGADDLADAAFAALQGLARVAGLNLVTRVAMAHLGADENDRQERTDSYQIIPDNQEA